MFDQIYEINPFSTEINDFVDIVNSVLKENVIDEQFRSLLRSFIASKEYYEKVLINDIKCVLKFANTIDNALSDCLYLEIQNKSREIDKINIAELIRVKEIKITENNNNNPIKYNNIIKLWQSFLDLRNAFECGLGKKFTEIYQAAYTVDCDSWNKFQGIKNYLEKLKEADKTSIFEYLTINYEYSSIRDLMMSRVNRQNMLERSSKWNEMKKDFTDKYNVAENENMPVVSRNTIQNNSDYIDKMCNIIEKVLPKQELANNEDMLRTILNSNENKNIFLQRLDTSDFAIDRFFGKTEHFFEYHINHNKRANEIDYTLYFDICTVKYCLNKTYNDEQYPFKIDTIRTDDYNFSDNYGFSDLARYKIGQYTLKEEQYKDIFLPNNINTYPNVADYNYSDSIFIKKEQVKRLLQSMYQINSGTDNIFIQFHNDIQEQDFNKGFAFVNQKVIYFEEFIDSEKNNQRSLKTIECNLVSEINNEEQFNEIFDYFYGSIFCGREEWQTFWNQIKHEELPNANILKKRKDIFRDVENIDFTKNENFKIAKITYPKIADSITRDTEMKRTILEKLKEIGNIEYKTTYNVQDGEYECMDGTVIKGKNITNRIKNENDQLQGALAEFSFIGDKMAAL